MNDREMIRLARDTLTDAELRVWIAKHAQGLGRRAGSAALGISEDAWRYRLRCADRKMRMAIDMRKDAA